MARAATPAAAAPPAAATPVAPSAGGWEEFLAFAHTQRPTLADHLGKCTVRELSEKGATLAVPRGFRFDYLSRRDHLSLVEELAGRFFGRSMRVQVEVGEASNGNAPVEAPRASTAELTSAAMQNPAVQAAVQILGGEVAEVRERRPRRREGE
jgi:hypothetical protein